MKGLYEKLSMNNSSFDKKIYCKSSMISISHAIEDIVIHFDLKAELYVFFQDYKFFTFEKEKYKRLDALCEKVIIFAKNIKFDEVLDFHNTIFVELRPDSPFCNEWSIIVNHPEQSIVFSSSELKEFNSFGQDSMRRFSCFLSFSPTITSEAIAHISEALKDYGKYYAPVYKEVRDLTQKEVYLNKNINFFINRTLNEIEEKTDTIINRNNLLSEALKENTELSYEILKRLSYAAEYKDEDSALHLVRMSYYSTRLYSKIERDKTKINYMTYASLLHDVGKIGIPDAILLKPGPLTADEFEIMKNHCGIGANILGGSKKELVQMAREIAYNHHEKWDGSGYPSGISGDKIPITARVVAIADVFDALLSKRIYKRAYPIDECLAIMNLGKQKHFDGELLEIFMSEVDEFIRFREKIERLSNEISIKDIFSTYFNEFEEFLK